MLCFDLPDLVGAVSIVTMTTVGYGDYYPVSGIGRVLGALIALSGVFVTSLMVGALSVLLVPTPFQVCMCADGWMNGARSDARASCSFVVLV